MNKTAQQYPGFSARMLAHNIDLIILLPFFYLLGYFIENNWMLFTWCFVLYVFYHSVFELTKWKATPGKKLQHIRVCHESGADLGMGQVFLRNAFKLISALILFIGFVMIAWDPKRRALHDRIVGAVVRFYG